MPFQSIINRLGRRSGRSFLKRSPAEQINLVVAILDGCHDDYVIELIQLIFGDRAHRVANPVDLSRNTLAAFVDRVNRVYRGPTLVDALDPDLAALLGDHNSRVTQDRYAVAGGWPMPTELAQACDNVERYRWGAGFAGLHLNFADRSQRIVAQRIPPNRLSLVYSDDDPIEPVRIEVLTQWTIDGKVKATTDVYDLTDLERPFYRVMADGNDVTARVHDGRTFEGDDYLDVWSYRDRRPYHPVVITGDDSNPYQTRSLTEATLMVAARWSAWGVGTDHASHPQRHTRGLRLQMQDSDAAEGGTGIATGPEYVYNWEDIDPVKPGDHWQDAPAFDPLTNAKAIRTYEASAMTASGIPVDMENTGGEPTETERKAVEELRQSAYSEARRYVSELLRRSAALANRLPGKGYSFSEEAYGALFREEVDAVLNTPQRSEEE